MSEEKAGPCRIRENQAAYVSVRASARKTVHSETGVFMLTTTTTLD